MIEKNVKGLNEEERKKGKAILWGRVENKEGKFAEGYAEVIETYNFTAKSCVDIIKQVQDGCVKAGFITPSKLLGADYLLSIEGSKLEISN